MSDRAELTQVLRQHWEDLRPGGATDLAQDILASPWGRRLVSERAALRERCEALEQERKQLRGALRIAEVALKKGQGAIFLGALSVVQHATEHQEPAAHEPQEPAS